MNLPRIARFAALGSAAALAGAAALGGAVLVTQLINARNRPSLDPRTAPDAPTEVGKPDAPELRLVILGDSVAAGVGAQEARQSLAGRVARGLADDGFRVHTRSVAVPNSKAVDVKIQASRALITSESEPYDLALIVVGAMDVCAWSRLEEVERATYRTVAALTNRGVEVVLATTGDLGSASCVRQPLRALWGLRSRRVAAAQSAGALAGGATVVDLVDTTGHSFAGDRGLYGEDGFHPSSDGYRLLADAVLPALRAAAREHRRV